MCVVSEDYRVILWQVPVEIPNIVIDRHGGWH